MSSNVRVTISHQKVKIVDWSSSSPQTTVLDYNDLAQYTQHWSLLSQDKVAIYFLMRGLLSSISAKTNKVHYQKTLLFIAQHLQDVDASEYEKLYQDIYKIMTMNRSYLKPNEYLDLMEKFYVFFDAHVMLKPLYYFNDMIHYSKEFQKLAFGNQSFQMHTETNGEISFSVPIELKLTKVPSSLLKLHNITPAEAIFFESITYGDCPLVHSYLKDNNLTIAETIVLLSGMSPTYSFEYDVDVFQYIQNTRGINIQNEIKNLQSHSEDIDGDDYLIAFNDLVDTLIKQLIGENNWVDVSMWAQQSGRNPKLSDYYNEQIQMNHPYYMNDYIEDIDYTNNLITYIDNILKYTHNINPL